MKIEFIIIINYFICFIPREYKSINGTLSHPPYRTVQILSYRQDKLLQALTVGIQVVLLSMTSPPHSKLKQTDGRQDKIR